jgi:hypothetical protein
MQIFIRLTNGDINSVVSQDMYKLCQKDDFDTKYS